MRQATFDSVSNWIKCRIDVRLIWVSIHWRHNRKEVWEFDPFHTRRWLISNSLKKINGVWKNRLHLENLKFYFETLWYTSLSLDRRPRSLLDRCRNVFGPVLWSIWKLSPMHFAGLKRASEEETVAAGCNGEPWLGVSPQFSPTLPTIPLFLGATNGQERTQPTEMVRRSDVYLENNWMQL